MYAEVAINVPVQGTFHYHIPDELAGQVQVGQLVQVAFRTAQQHGVVVGLDETTTIARTKPVEAILDSRPVVTPGQIAIARWMSQHNLMPLGSCVWLFLPPGIAGRRDVLVTLVDDEPDGLDELETRLVALLRRRGPLRGHQLNMALTGKNWRDAVGGLQKAGIVRTENILAPPRARPKIVRTVMLAINPDQIDLVARHLGRNSKQADLLEVIAVAGDEGLPVERALKIAETTQATLKKVEEAGLVTTNRHDKAAEDPLLVWLKMPREAVSENLIALRKGERLHRVLKVLARENGPMDVSWLYAQTDAKLPDLKKLEDEGLVLLGEAESWRDSLAQRDFVPAAAPSLTPEQAGVWASVEAAIKRWDWDDTPQPPYPMYSDDSENVDGVLPASDLDPLRPAMQDTEDPSPTLPVNGEGVDDVPFTPLPLAGEAGRGSHEGRLPDDTWSYWRTPPHLWHRLKPLAQEMRQEPTPAEDRLWQHLRRKQLDHKFRRQHPIERFIVDFFCSDAGLVVEVDGEIHQYTPVEDAIRQGVLESMGLRVLRFTNAQVMDDTDGVLESIRRAIANPSPAIPVDTEIAQESNIFLLHGVTGSGKTEIYLRAIELTLAQGRQAIFLVPEIALTAQTIRRVAARFPGQVAVAHGSLSEGERYDTWRRAREGLLGVVVGARSALFTPFPDIGLIILDEEHDQSYKQGAGLLHPYYHTRAVAEQMMRHNNGTLILGSATPDIETYFRADRGDIRLLELPNRIMGHRTRIMEQSAREHVVARYYPARANDALTIDLPEVEVVDMRNELKAGNTGMFSRSLQEALTVVLERQEQAMLFLNRRGMNTYVFCRDCGYVALCPNCDMPITYHNYDQIMRCHLCGYQASPPRVCPNCQSSRIRYFGAGTQQVEQELIHVFPMARVLRWDADTARTPSAHEELLQRFIDRKADVLVGTQMVAKGLDLPLVTLVGMVSADVGLNLPDFRAGERTFQLLTQVAGRAGRGLLGGRAVLQTYQPDHYIIEAAAAQDYARFYQQEIAYRRELGYPPFRRLARIVFQFPNETKARAEADRAANLLRHRIHTLGLTGTEMIGPAPCFFSKVANVHRWHLMLRSPDPTLALESIDVPSSWQVDIDPVGVL